MISGPRGALPGNLAFAMDALPSSRVSLERDRLRFGSSQAADSERSLLGSCLRLDRMAPGGFPFGRWRVVEKIGAGHEEEIAGQRCREVEDAVVVAGGVTAEHIRQHLFDHSRVPSVPNEVCTELTFTHCAERHVVTDDLKLVAAVVFNSVQSHV